MVRIDLVKRKDVIQMNDIFRRVEKKYIITNEQFTRICKFLNKYMDADQYGKSTICNIYFDSPNYDLISHSITKPYFKEKIRLRSYNTPKKESKVYLEIKRKADVIVGKRRIAMNLKDFEKYIQNPELMENENVQIKKELDYYFRLYSLEPKMYISYEREAFYEKNNRDFRITFDRNIKARDYNLELDSGSYGENILSPELVVMEIKTLNVIPIWFIKVLNGCNIQPCGFSKYGEAYTQITLQANNPERLVI